MCLLSFFIYVAIRDVAGYWFIYRCNGIMLSMIGQQAINYKNLLLLKGQDYVELLWAAATSDH